MSLSKFLPEAYKPTDTIIVLAGRGDYPKLMIDRMQRAGVSFALIAFEGETSDELFHRVPDNSRRRVKIGQLNKTLNAMTELGGRYAVMVGQIRPGRLFKGLHPDLKAIKILGGLKERNAETIYSAIVDEINAIGIDVLDARVFIDDQLAEPGLMTGGKLKVEDSVIDHGIHIANEIARLDIGQGVVVKQGTVLCVEEFDGTDSMLKRASKFDTDGKVFVKTVKPNQNFAIDIPVFGERTLESMKEGGVSVAVLSAGQTIMLHKERVLARAKKEKIQIYGF